MTIDASKVKSHLDEVVRSSVEETLNAMLDAEAERVCQAKRYERSLDRQDTRAGSYQRKLQTKAGDVNLTVPRLRRLPLETAIIERYRRREMWRVNRKRLHRLWRQGEYKVRQNKRKKSRLGVSENGIMRRRAESINGVWAWDFIHDRDERGRPLKWLVSEDEFTRQGLAVEADRSIKATDVLEVLSQLILIRGAPRHIRSDNGPEFARFGHLNRPSRGVRIA